MATIEDFKKLDIRVGKIIEVEEITGQKFTTHKLKIDFGPEIGTKTSGARLVRYKITELKDRLILGVVNLPARQVGKILSEVLTLGVADEQGECILIQPDTNAPLGSKLY